MYWPFYDSGFTLTGPKKINYEAGESIAFNAAYLSSLASNRSVVWNFYKSSDYSLVKSITGLTPSTSFTLDEGKDGLDIEMVLDFGAAAQTKFRKRRRVVIIPDKSVADVTLNISTIPMLSGGVVFSNSATATVTSGSSTVSTSAAHGASVGDIVVFIQSGTHRTYRASTGTTGSTIILDRNWEGSSGSITNANTRRGLDIQHRFDASAWAAGSIIHFTGTLYTARCRFINIIGTAGDEILITNPSDSSICEFVRVGTAQDDVFQFNDVCRHVRLIGDKDSSGNYRFKLTNGGLSAQHFTIGNTHDHDNIRISALRVHNADSTGIKPKLDSVNRVVGAWDDCWVYDNYITNSINEGIYMGYFLYSYDSSFNGGDYHHAMRRAKCFANRVESCGWDNLQMSCCDLEAEFCYNYSLNGATSGTGSQNFGAVMNGGFSGDFYNNLILGNTVQCLPSFTTRIYNNVIYNTTYGNGLFVRRADNPALGSPIFNPYDPSARLYVWQNVIVSLNDSIYLLDINDQGGTLMPLLEIWITNNFLGYTGSIVEGFIRYNEPASGQTRTMAPNVTVAGTTPINNALQFENYSTQDTRLKDTSSVFLPENEGTDVSAKLTTSNVPLRMFVDIYDQVVPERGYWKQGPYAESTNHENELAAYIGKTQIQWYKTAQSTDSSGWSDKEKLARFFGGTIKKINQVGGSAKNRYLVSVKAYGITGLPSPETFDQESLL